MDVVGDVGDVNLQKPAAVFAPFNVNSVIEISRGLAVDGDDGKFTEILAPCAVSFTDGMSNLLGVVQDLGRKCVRQVMLADDDLRVDAKIPRAAKDFNNAAGRWNARAAVANQFRVDHGAVQLGDVREAPATRRLFFRSG